MFVLASLRLTCAEVAAACADGIASKSFTLLPQDQWPLLVVVPASLRLAWAEELAKWLPHVRPSQVHVIEGRTDRLSGSSIPRVLLLDGSTLFRTEGSALSEVNALFPAILPEKPVKDRNVRECAFPWG